MSRLSRRDPEFATQFLIFKSKGTRLLRERIKSGVVDAKTIHVTSCFHCADVYARDNAQMATMTLARPSFDAEGWITDLFGAYFKSLVRGTARIHRLRSYGQEAGQVNRRSEAKRHHRQTAKGSCFVLAWCEGSRIVHHIRAQALHLTLGQCLFQPTR
jgi:hypothetical protein